jgi:hypothetical protein
VTGIETELLTALRDLEHGAQVTKPAGPRPDLSALLARVDGLTERLPKDNHPDLLHYLQRKSYDKARRWLEGRDTENRRGTCAPGRHRS